MESGASRLKIGLQPADWVRKMGIMKILSGVFVAAVLAFAGTHVSAATLDFTESAFIGANGNVAGTTYSITTSGGSLTWGQSQDGSTCIGLACARDGLGVGDDEITIGGEEVRIDFGTTIRLTGLAFLDLFSSGDGQNQERAMVAYSGGSMFFDSLLSETPGGDSGFRAVNGLDILTDFLVFTAGGTNDNLGRDDYALAAVTVTAVPLPPALAMFLVALGGIGILSRKRPSKNT